MDDSRRGLRGGRGGRRPWRGRPKTPRRSTENLSVSGLDDDEGTHGNEHSVPIYDSSEFEENSEETRGRGRSSNQRELEDQEESQSYSDQERGGVYRHLRGQRSVTYHRGERQSNPRHMGYRRLEELYHEDNPDIVLLQLVTKKADLNNY